MQIFTSYYANVRDVEGYKVQISVSAPSNFLADYCFDSIAPNKSTLWNHKNGFINNGLNMHKDEILAEMRQVLAQASLAKQDKVILLCWEGKSKFCHRHLFADWYQQQTGIKITEL